MTPFAEEMRRCGVVLALRAVLEAGGNQCAAARALGVHRNTICRAMRAAGYRPEQLKRMARSRAIAGEKKPPASETMARAEERRIA
jgi:transposase-like protein